MVPATGTDSKGMMTSVLRARVFKGKITQTMSGPRTTQKLNHRIIRVEGTSGDV